ncbi:hypothetical protein QUW13_06990 [Enterococcus hirae]|nr:hypothetical protein [Enterococcaceae bacterium]MCI1919438.1 hypothetical protein [Enterococcaceae bacterium]MDM8213615.1 hypothetical protein [Enterococcus hirae]
MTTIILLIFGFLLILTSFGIRQFAPEFLQQLKIPQPERFVRPYWLAYLAIGVLSLIAAYFGSIYAALALVFTTLLISSYFAMVINRRIR